MPRLIRAETDQTIMEKVAFLRKAKIPERLPSNNRIDYHVYGLGIGSFIAETIAYVLHTAGFKGRVFREKNHKYATLEDDARKALEDKCNFYNCNKV